MKKHILVFLVAFGLYCCTSNSKTNKSEAIDTIAIQSEISSSKNEKFDSLSGNNTEVLHRTTIEKITTDKLYYSISDSMTITLPLPHPKQLAIVTPDGTFFFIASEIMNTNLPPLILDTMFVKMNKIKLSLKKEKAYPYDLSFKEKISIFKSSGTYKILIGDNLESDELNTEVHEINIK